MEFYKTIYAGVEEHSYEKLLCQMITSMVTAVKREEKPPRNKFTPRWVNVLASARKVM